MKILKFLVLLAVVWSGLSCSMSNFELKEGQFVLKPRGERIRIETMRGVTSEGEFLFIDEQAVYILDEARTGDTVYRTVTIKPWSDIRELKILGLANHQWFIPVLGFQVAPALLLGGTYAVVSDSSEFGNAVALAGLALIPAAVTTLVFLASSRPAPELTGEMNYEHAKDLQRYARYPFLLDPELKQRILDSLRRSEPLPVVKLP